MAALSAAWPYVLLVLGILVALATAATRATNHPKLARDAGLFLSGLRTALGFLSMMEHANVGGLKLPLTAAQVDSAQRAVDSASGALKLLPLALLFVGASGCDSLQVVGGLAIAAFIVLVAYVLLAAYAHLRHLAIVLALVALPARAQHFGLFAVLNGDVLTAPETRNPAIADGVRSTARLDKRPDWIPDGRLHDATTHAASQVLVADAGPTAATRVTSTIAAAPMVPPASGDSANAVPLGAANLTAPVVPPACSQCAQQVAGKVLPSRWSPWYTAAIAVGSAVAMVLDQLHNEGVIGH